MNWKRSCRKWALAYLAVYQFPGQWASMFYYKKFYFSKMLHLVTILTRKESLLKVVAVWSKFDRRPEEHSVGRSLGGRLWAVCRVLVYVHVCCNFYFFIWVSFGLCEENKAPWRFQAMNEWQPPNLRRSRSICVTKYVKRDPIRRTSLSTDFHKNQSNGSVETPISQVRFHALWFLYLLTYKQHCFFME